MGLVGGAYEMQDGLPLPPPPPNWPIIYHAPGGAIDTYTTITILVLVSSPLHSNIFKVLLI